MSVAVIVVGVYVFGFAVGWFTQHLLTKAALDLCHEYKDALESQREATARALRLTSATTTAKQSSPAPVFAGRVSLP